MTGRRTRETASSPSLGRTLTTDRHPGESALWNASALALDAPGGLSVGAASPRETRGSGYLRVPRHVSSRSKLVPRVITFGFLQHREDRKVSLQVQGAPDLVTRVTREETIGIVGAGFTPAPGIGFGLGLRTYLGQFETVDTAIRSTLTLDPPAGSPYTEIVRYPGTSRVKVDQSDLDVSLTWDATPGHRFAVAGYYLFGSEAERGDGETFSLRETVLGWGWTRDRWQLGAEAGYSSEGADFSAGANWRLAKELALDLGAGSRFQAVQGGVDVYIGSIESQCRVRYDETESTAASVQLGYPDLIPLASGRNGITRSSPRGDLPRGAPSSRRSPGGRGRLGGRHGHRRVRAARRVRPLRLDGLLPEHRGRHALDRSLPGFARMPAHRARARRVRRRRGSRARPSSCRT